MLLISLRVHPCHNQHELVVTLRFKLRKDFWKNFDTKWTAGVAMIPCASVSLTQLRIFFFPSPGSISMGIAPALNRANATEMNFMLKGIKSKTRSPFLNPYWFNPEAMRELSSSNSWNEMEVPVCDSVTAVWFGWFCATRSSEKAML